MRSTGPGGCSYSHTRDIQERRSRKVRLVTHITLPRDLTSGDNARRRLQTKALWFFDPNPSKQGVASSSLAGPATSPATHSIQRRNRDHSSTLASPPII